MKLDIDFIAQILTIAEEYPRSKIMQRELLANLKEDDAVDINDKFYYHMMCIKELGFLDCDHEGRYKYDGFGFTRTLGTPAGGTPEFVDMYYELTMAGHQFLDAMRHDTISEKVKKFFVDMTMEEIKKRFPTFLMMLIQGTG